LFLASFSLIIVVAKYSVMMERLKLQQVRRAAGPRGLRSSRGWDRPWRKKEFGDSQY